MNIYDRTYTPARGGVIRFTVSADDRVAYVSFTPNNGNRLVLDAQDLMHFAYESEQVAEFLERNSPRE